ncbi:serine hydrolase domain-containing protein [Teichococcus vastitatis]|uniref:Beta-lactamase family protein n=1 Tax=Teichococcus vastitatis TaxID=2307076 RepID=A0ABS9W9R4_9PROT|nr:serine hydrolase domain-containing protein [Pseudoroseomonas vastitatis]MCI0756046.1 beta-lactamase family protein [Pseudoroseomonas vastitatis]
MVSWQQAEARAAVLASGWTADEPGGVVLGFDRGGVRFVRAAGLASLEHRVPFTAATPTRLASITKHVFCAAALRDGLDLARPLGAVVQGLSPDIAAVPLRRALDMTGGLPDLAESFGLLGIPSTASIDRPTLLELARGLPGVNFTPGHSIAYSNTGYRLAEAALSSRFDELLARHFPGHGLFYPEDEAEPVPGLATGYWKDKEGHWQRGRYGLNFSASGGLACSAEALMRWAQQLMEGQGGTAGLWQQLACSGRLQDGTETGYGLGLSRVALTGPLLWGHGGSLPGYKNHMLLAPELGAGVIVLSNREETAAYGLSLAVMAALTGMTLPGPGRLPPGLFSEEDGPFWAESTGDAVLLLGAQEPLHAGDDGTMRGLQSHLPFELRPGPEGGLEGRIGHRAVRLDAVEAEAGLDHRLLGPWRGSGFGDEARLEISLSGSGAVLRLPGIAAPPVRLRPLGRGKALAVRPNPPGASRFALWLEQPDTLLLVSQRSRVLRFRRC